MLKRCLFALMMIICTQPVLIAYARRQGQSAADAAASSFVGHLGMWLIFGVIYFIYSFFKGKSKDNKSETKTYEQPQNNNYSASQPKSAPSNNYSAPQPKNATVVQQLCCSQCGRFVNNSMVFCPGCGQKLDWSTQTTPTQAPTPAPAPTPKPAPEPPKQQAPARKNPVSDGKLHCPVCSAVIDPSMSQCADCGQKLDWSTYSQPSKRQNKVTEFNCPVCKTRINTTMDKCPNCGQKFDWSTY